MTAPIPARLHRSAFTRRVTPPGVTWPVKQLDDPYVGNMNDSSYTGQVTPGGVTRRVNADGNMVVIEEFKGHFVWADYAATWCQPCISQAPALKELEKSLGARVVFLTVMSSASQEDESISD